MKRITLCITLCAFIGSIAFAQNSPKSPPKSVEAKIGTTDISINYNSPFKKGRTLWGDLVPYDEVWRTGANSATKITFSGDVNVEGKMLKAGTYSLFTIPTKKNWTVIFNKVAEQWGAYSYDESKDALRVEVSPSVAAEESESMTFEISDGAIHLKWGKMVVPVRIES